MKDKRQKLKDLKDAIEGKIGGGFIGGTLIVNGENYTIGKIDDREVETAVARLYVRYKSETAAFYDRAVELLKEAGETPEQWKETT